jgi:hypothetical protein
MNLNSILISSGIDPSASDSEDIAKIIRILERQIRDLVTSPFYFSEVIAVIESLVIIYGRWGTMPRDQIAEAVKKVFYVLDEEYKIVDYLDSLIPTGKIPLIGSLVKNFSGMIIRWVLFSIAVPAAIKLIKE